MKICSIIIKDKKVEVGMGFKREFNFDDDMELLNLKYQMNGGSLSEYFQNEIGANEPIQRKINNEIQQPKDQL